MTHGFSGENRSFGQSALNEEGVPLSEQEPLKIGRHCVMVCRRGAERRRLGRAGKQAGELEMFSAVPGDGLTGTSGDRGLCGQSTRIGQRFIGLDAHTMQEE